jgi:hypothetical protein
MLWKYISVFHPAKQSIRRFEKKIDRNDGSFTFLSSCVALKIGHADAKNRHRQAFPFLTPGIYQQEAAEDFHYSRLLSEPSRGLFQEWKEIDKR